MANLLIRVLVDAAGVGPAFAKVSGEAEAMSKSVSASSNQSAAAHKVFKGAVIASAAAVAGLGLAVDKSVKAAEAEQASTARMDEAFKAAHVSSSAFSDAIATAESATRKLGFSNTDVRDSLGSLIIATHDGNKALADMSVATDIARFKHIGLTDASRMLTMAMAGSQRAVRQLGIVVIPVTTNFDALKRSGEDLTTVTGRLDAAHAKLLDKMATGQAVIAEVTDKVHGQAQAFADTAAGGMAQFHAQMEALQESLGTALLPALTSLAGTLANVTAFLSQHTTAVKVAALTLGTLAVAVLAVSAAEAVVRAATLAWTAAQWLLNAALDANPIGVVIIAIAALVAGIVIAYKESETFRRVVTAAFQDVKDWLTKNWPVIVMIISGPFAPLVALATNAFGVRSALINAFVAVKTEVMAALNDLRSAFTSVWDTIKGVVDGAAKVLAASVGGIIAVFNGILDVLHSIEGAATSAANAVSKVTGAAGGIAGKVSSIVSHIPGFAEGGVVPGAIGQPQLAIVHGGETVIPVGRGGAINHFTVNVQGHVLTEGQLLSLMQKLAALDLKSGGVGVPGTA